MEPTTLIAIFNIVAPQVFGLIGRLRNQNPDKPYREILEEARIALDAEEIRLLQEMDQAVRDGAVPRPQPQ